MAALRWAVRDLLGAATWDHVTARDRPVRARAGTCGAAGHWQAAGGVHGYRDNGARCSGRGFGGGGYRLLQTSHGQRASRSHSVPG